MENKSEAPKEEPKMGEPEELKGDGIKTTVSQLKDVIKGKLQDLKDLATMEIRLPVDVRMKKRLESIRKMSSAEHFKIDRHWKTNAPEMYVAALEGRKLSQSEAEIRFSVYETDKKGNKKLYEHYGEVVLANGDRIKRVNSAEYRVAYEAIERIVFRKPITREILRIEPRSQ